MWLSRQFSRESRALPLATRLPCSLSSALPAREWGALTGRGGELDRIRQGRAGPSSAAPQFATHWAPGYGGKGKATAGASAWQLRQRQAAHRQQGPQRQGRPCLAASPRRFRGSVASKATRANSSSSTTVSASFAGGVACGLGVPGAIAALARWQLRGARSSTRGPQERACTAGSRLLRRSLCTSSRPRERRPGRSNAPFVPSPCDSASKETRRS